MDLEGVQRGSTKNNKTCSRTRVLAKMFKAHLKTQCFEYPQNPTNLQQNKLLATMLKTFVLPDVFDPLKINGILQYF